MGEMKMLRFWVLGALAAGMAIPAVAQMPDFSGTWTLNLTTSFTAGDHPAKDFELTRIIVQKAGTIEQTDTVKHASIMNIQIPDSKSTMVLVADGQEHEVTGPGFFLGLPPSKMKAVAEWQGGTLLVSEEGQSFAGASTTKRRYFLSGDGLHLIELVEGHNGFGDIEQRLVFDKKP